VIRSFRDARTAALFADQFVSGFQGVARRAKRKFEAISAATRPDDVRVPPSNRLEKLKGDLEGFYSIRVNDQWRAVFRWEDRHAYSARL
jgi:proteic killer suppression protein